MEKIKSIYLSSIVSLVAGLVVAAYCTIAAGSDTGWIANWGAVAGYFVAILVGSGFLVQRVRSIRLLAKGGAGLPVSTERAYSGISGLISVVAALAFVATAFVVDAHFEKWVAGISSLLFWAGAGVFFGRERSLAWAPQPVVAPVAKQTLTREAPSAPAPVQPAARVVPRPEPKPAPVEAPARPPVAEQAPRPQPKPEPVAPVAAAPARPAPAPVAPAAPLVAEKPAVVEPAPRVVPVAPPVVEAPRPIPPAPPVVEVPKPAPVAPVPVVEPVRPAPVVVARPEPVPEPVAEAAKPAPATHRIPMPEDDFSFDQDIREIFIEEATEVLETINVQFPIWAANFSRNEALLEFRRGFHTLKGSGRMVGARVLGELAWNIESLLNKVRDKIVPPNPVMVTLISETLILVPDLIDDFANSKTARFNTSPLMSVADAMARGEAISARDVASAVQDARLAQVA